MGGRKKFVDWQQWRKRFVIRKSQKDQDREELIDEADYVMHLKARKVESPIARKRFRALCEDNPGPVEGEAGDTKCCVTFNKQRNWETERFEEGGVDEGSKVVKHMKAEDVQKLKEFAVNKSK